MTTTQKQRVLNFAKQRGLNISDATKNASSLRKLAGRLTPRQQRRLRKNGPIKVKP